MIRFWLLAFLSVTLLSSCMRTIQYIDAEQINLDIYGEKVESIQQIGDITIETKYGGDAFQYLVFQLDIENKTDSLITLSSDQISLVCQGPYDRDIALEPLDRDEMIANLKSEKQIVNTEKKANLAANILTTGLSILSIAFAPGGVGTADAVFISAESTAYMIDDNRQFNLVKRDIDDQIIYLEDWVLTDTKILPGAKKSFDILFERFTSEGDVRLKVDCEDNQFVSSYRLFLQEEKVRGR